MVAFAEIQSSLASLKSLSSPVAVFVGATQGIGRAALLAFASNTTAPRAHLIARNRHAWDSGLLAELKAANPEGQFEIIEAGDLSLLKNVEKACAELLKKETKVDLLFQSQGYISLSGQRDETPEALDALLSIRYYARMLTLTLLLPLLTAAPSPHAVTILAGGNEGAIDRTDFPLQAPRNQSVIGGANASATYTTLFLEQFAARNPRVACTHAFPGFVKTGLLESDRLPGWARFLGAWVLGPLLTPFAYTPAEAGARGLFAGTSARFPARAMKEEQGAEEVAVGSDGVKGSGVYTLQGNSEAVANDKVLRPLREQGVDKELYAHTIAEFERVRAL